MLNRYKNKIKAAAILVLLTPLLSACPREVFLGGWDVKSGKYYLKVHGRIYDDPKILQRYKYRITSSSRFEFARHGGCGDPAMSLWSINGPHYDPHNRYARHRPLRSVSGCRNIHIPKAMQQYGKWIARTEYYPHVDDYWQRLFELRSVDGIKISASLPSTYSQLSHPLMDREKTHLTIDNGRYEYHYQEDDINGFVLLKRAPNHQQETDKQRYVSTVLFPMMVTHAGSTYQPLADLKQLKQRIEQEMAQQGISGYYLNGAVSLLDKQGIRLNPKYAIKGEPVRANLKREYLLVANNQSEDDLLVLPDYKIYIFAMSILCNQSCHTKMKTLPFFDWITSEVSHAEFTQKIEAFIKSHNKQFDPNDYIFYHYLRWYLTRIFPHDEYYGYNILDKDTGYINEGMETLEFWSKGKLMQAQRPYPKPRTYQYKNHRIFWQYPPEYAVNRPYPDILLKYRR